MCELWLRGTVNNLGPKPYDRRCQTGWQSGRALPTIIYHSSSSGVTYYTSSSSCVVYNIGWWGRPEYYTKGCIPPPGTNYDCLNGLCRESSDYGTPGQYSSLPACQAACAGGSSCNGECVPLSEIAALEEAANGLRARLCE